MPLILHPNPESVGSIYAHLFENARAGVPRNLYWSVTVPCLPIEWDEDEYECAVTCEWIVWPVRDWKQLHGVGLSTAASPALIECSLYFEEHHPVRVEKLEILGSAGGARFRVCLAGTFDLDGFDDLDGTNMRFSLECDVEFEGLVVVPGNLFPKPQGEAEVLHALSTYVDLEAFGAPLLERSRYVLPPSIREA